MLVLQRKVGQKITIGEEPNAVTLMVCDVNGQVVKLGFEGPRHVPIVRDNMKKGPKDGKHDGSSTQV